uniref:Uncharacterized protein n=1 Tax=Romanomermis culicivorax TaxID=13658 RepID=A0A915IUH3_ROMCU
MKFDVSNDNATFTVAQEKLESKSKMEFDVSKEKKLLFSVAQKSGRYIFSPPAVANSPSGCANLWQEVGAMQIGERNEPKTKILYASVE